WCFFFSSRRRHTRFSRDWSSDVCSSDLTVNVKVTWPPKRCSAGAVLVRARSAGSPGIAVPSLVLELGPLEAETISTSGAALAGRSEERRVGKERRTGGAADYRQQKREYT